MRPKCSFFGVCGSMFSPFCSEGIENLDSSGELHQELSRVSKSSRCFFCLDFSRFPLLLPSLPKLLLPPRRSMVSPSRGGVFPGLDSLCPCWNWCGGLGNDLQEMVLAEPSCSRWEFRPGSRELGRGRARGCDSRGACPARGGAAGRDGANRE